MGGGGEAEGRPARTLLDSGYRIEWGGQFENFERASARLALVIRGGRVIIIGMLFWMFEHRPAWLAVFFSCPLAATGGMIGPLARGLPFSLPAAVGFIAPRRRFACSTASPISSDHRGPPGGRPQLKNAVPHGAAHVGARRAHQRPGAALGFLGQVSTTSAGSEVQRLLATVVIVGMFGTCSRWPSSPAFSPRPSRAGTPGEIDEDDEFAGTASSRLAAE